MRSGRGPMSMRNKLIPLKITLIYVIVGSLWILFSDKALHGLGIDTAALTRLQTVKGLIFIGITALVFYLLISRSFAQLVSTTQALLDSEERFRKRYEAVRVGVIVRNKNGDITYCNKAATEILGISDKDMIREGIWRLVEQVVQEDGTPFEQDQYPTIVALRTGQPVRNMVVGIHADQPEKQRWVMVNVEPVLGPADGSVEEVIATFLDITDLKQSKEALRDSEKHLADIISFLPDATFVVDKQGRVIAWNRAMEDLSGVKAEDMLGKSDYEYAIPFYGERRPLLVDLVLHPDDLVEQHYPELIRDGDALVAEVEVGGGRWLWGKATPLYDSRMRIVGAIETVRDLTERKRWEDELRSNEQLLRQFIEYTPAAVAMFDKEMRYLLASRRWLIDYKLGERDIIGLSHYEVFPEIPQRWKDIHQRVLKGAIERADEDRFERSDGSVDWVRWELLPWYDAHGEIGGIIMFTEVITARKQAEEELRRQRERERQIEAEAEEAKHRFYMGTIYSVTDGKLNLVNRGDIDKLLSDDARQFHLESTRDLRPLRDLIKEVCVSVGMVKHRTFDLVTAAGEAAANAVKHANGGAVHIGIKDDRIQVCISDRGQGIDALVLPRATLMTRYSTTTSMGLGYSLILASVDRVYLSTGPEGTCVLMEKAIAEPAQEINLDALPDTW